jgi:hypothetical protein
MSIVKKYVNELEGNGVSKGQADSFKAIPISDAVIKEYIPDANIVVNADLDRYPSIDSLLPNNMDCVFILYQHEVNTGHWVLLSKYENTIEYFDSYGGYIDKPLTWISAEKRAELGEEPFLSRMLKDCKYDVIYNAYDFQDESSTIATCGRWCVLRARTIFGDRIRLDEFITMMKGIKKETKLSYDNIVSDLIGGT